jgi:hypothetical protein
VKTYAELMEWIEARSHREDDCLVWRLAVAGDGRPQGGYMDGKRRITLNVRRVLWEAKHDKPAPRKMVVVCTCDTERCVNPEHLKLASRSSRQNKSISAAHHLQLTLAARARATTKLSAEAVQDIRNGEGTAEEKARRHGITTSYAEDVMRHRAWREVIASPFAGLMP